jgi:hypothetical protein
MLRYSTFVMLQAMATVVVLLTEPMGVSWI